MRGAPHLRLEAVQLLTVAQVAEQVGLSDWAVRQAIHDGELVASKIRNRLRIDAVDLQAWIDGSRVSAPGRATQDLPRALTPSTAYPEAGSFRARMRRKEQG